MPAILIINDSPSINVILSYKLETAGFTVDTVETASDGINRANESHYDLIVVDFKLPDTDGSEVCRLLKNQENREDIPVVMMSAHESDSISEIAKTAGADGCITLPIDNDDFVEAIKRFVPA